MGKSKRKMRKPKIKFRHWFRLRGGEPAETETKEYLHTTYGEPGIKMEMSGTDCEPSCPNLGTCKTEIGDSEEECGLGNIQHTNPVEEKNPYAYLERDFSSENYKIEIKNLPKFYGIGEFRKLLNEKLELKSNKVKTTRKNSPFAFVCFRSELDRENAIKILSGYKWKGKELQAMKAKPAPDPLVKKRKTDADQYGSNKKLKEEEVTQEEKLKNSTIPFWNIEYKKQLEYKLEDMKQVLRKMGNDLVHLNPDLQKWIEKQRSIYDGMPCELQEIKFAEAVEGYRNKCEFTVGIDEDTGLPTVGFRLGSYVDGTTGVGPVDNLVHIPQAMKTAVKLFQEFVRGSHLKVFSPEHHTGHFRQLMVRSTTDQLMLVVGIHPQDLGVEEINDFKKDLVNYFSTGDGKEAKVTSLYYQKIVKKNHHNDFIPSEHLWGETHIYESIMGLKFRISPEAFFQINTKGAEILYQAAIELAEPLQGSTVLDVCCGTGTIGLCFAQRCSQVLGIEVVSQAVVDARANAESNKITNAEFYAGKAEDILGDICFKATGKDVIAIVDPPRAGLQKKAIFQIRKINKIRKMVYVSCNPTAALQNFMDFGKPESKKVNGEPLIPVKAIAVDMFPFTKHCELVLCFERWDKLLKQLDESKSE